MYEDVATPDGVEYDVEQVSVDGINVGHLYVAPASRREGRGRRTIQRILEAAYNDGIVYAVLNVGGGESTAQFAEDLGFEVLEEDADRITAIVDPLEDVFK